MMWTVRYELNRCGYCITMEGADRAEIYSKLLQGGVHYVDVVSIEPKS